jgi:hypothetical protein
MPTTTEAAPYRTGQGGPRRRAEHVMREGATVGLVGAMVAMLLFLVVDLAAGAPLRTPALLGSALFHDGSRASQVAGYTAVHLAAFVLFGLAMSGLFALAEREKRVLALIFMLGCCLAVVFVAMVYGLSQWVRDEMAPWVFLAGHILAGAAVVGVLFRFHRRLLRELPTAAE